MIDSIHFYFTLLTFYNWITVVIDADNKVWVSDGLVLNGLFGVNISLFVEDTIGTEGTLDCVVGFQFRFFAALLIGWYVLLFPQT